SHFDGEFAAIFPTTKKIAPDSHGTAAGVGKKIFAIAGMSTAETFWKQHFDRAADQLAQRIAEDSCGRLVCEVDHAGRVNHDHRVRRSIEYEPEFFLGALPLGNVNA